MHKGAIFLFGGERGLFLLFEDSTSSLCNFEYFLSRWGLWLHSSFLVLFLNFFHFHFFFWPLRKKKKKKRALAPLFLPFPPPPTFPPYIFLTFQCMAPLFREEVFIPCDWKSRMQKLCQTLKKNWDICWIVGIHIYIHSNRCSGIRAGYCLFLIVRVKGGRE